MKLNYLYESKAFQKRSRVKLNNVALKHNMEPEQVYSYILAIDPTGRKYLPWLLTNFDNDLDMSVRYDLEEFEKLIQKRAQINHDITSYTLSSLSKTIKNFRGYESKRSLGSKSGILSKGFKKVKETDNMVTYQASDPDSIAAFVKGRTPWCVANASHAKNYMKNNRGLFLILNKIDSSPLACFSGDYKEFSNLDNKQLYPMRLETISQMLTDPMTWDKEDLEIILASYLPQNDFYWKYHIQGGNIDFDKYGDESKSNPDIAMAMLRKKIWPRARSFGGDDSEIISNEEYEEIKRKNPKMTMSQIYDMVEGERIAEVANDPKNIKMLELIASDPKTAYEFAAMSKKSFPMGEKAILTSPWWTALYFNFKSESKIRDPGYRNFSDWPEAEAVITQDMDALVRWSVGRGRQVKYEQELAETGSANALLMYANRIAHKDWHELVPEKFANKAENTIINGPSSFIGRMSGYTKNSCDNFKSKFLKLCEVYAKW